MAGRYSRWFVSRSAFFARLRAFMLGFHLVFSIAALTFCFVASFTLPVSFTTCETVAIETAAAFATSLMVTRPDPRTLRIFAITFSESVSRHASPTSPSCGVLIPRFVSVSFLSNLLNCNTHGSPNGQIREPLPAFNGRWTSAFAELFR
jgi:hypothetical protein